MKTILTAATALALVALTPTLSEMGTVRANHARHLFLAEANGPSPGGHDTAVLAENESNGSSPGGRDSAQI